jgi:membrane protein required for colicin V production
MANFNWFDFVILAILFFSILAGLSRGLVREVIAVLTWVAAYVVASMFANRLALAFTGDHANGSISALSFWMCFIGLFIITLLAGGIINHIISRSVDSVGLGIGNRFFGGIFGLIRGYLVALVVIYILQFTWVKEEAFWSESRLIPSFKTSLDTLDKWVQPGFDRVKTTMEQTLRDTQNIVANIM